MKWIVLLALSLTLAVAYANQTEEVKTDSQEKPANAEGDGIVKEKKAIIEADATAEETVEGSVEGSVEGTSAQ